MGPKRKERRHQRCVCVSAVKVKMCECLKFNNLHQNSCSCVLTGPSSVFKIVKMIMERNFQPVIIFSFSKKECEAYALQVAKLDFNRGMCICVAIQHTVVLLSHLIVDEWQVMCLTYSSIC